MRPSLCSVLVLIHDQTCCWVEEEFVGPRAVFAEVEHGLDCPGEIIKGPLYALTPKPVVLNEPQNGSLVRGGIVDEIHPGKGRNHEQRQPRTQAAASLSV